MTYRRRNKNKTNKKIVSIIAILVILFLFGSTVKGLIHWTAVPVLKIKDVVTYPFKSTIDQMVFKKNLINENEELKNVNRRLEIENLTVESLKKENESLRELLNYSDNINEFKIGKVLTKPPFSPYDTFVINLGEDEIYPGDLVYHLGVLIGEVKEVYRNTSVVRLKSSAGESLLVSVLDRETEAFGIGGGGFVIFLPKDLKISEGEIIFADQSPVGKVDRIESDESGAFQRIYFRYPLNINTVDFIEVLNINN